jgi:acetyl esterase/lipase
MYGQDSNLKIVIWKADSAGPPGPAVVFFHGGGFVSGDDTQFSKMCEELASRSITCASADYTLKAGNAEVWEAKQAVAWVHLHAGELHVNAARIFVGGGSAGGYLALSTALIRPEQASMPAGLVLLNPAFRPVPPGPTDDLESDMRAPLPPTIWFHGTADQVVPYATAQAFVADAKADGARVDFQTYPGRKHGFFNYSARGGNGDFYAVTKSVIDFIKANS